MPATPKRSCSVQPCAGFAVAGGRCLKHQVESDTARGSSWDRGYDSTWRKLRIMVLAEEPLCCECMKLNQVVAALDVDHIIPVRVRPDLRLVRSNLQSLCRAHHNQKTRAEMSRKVPS